MNNVYLNTYLRNFFFFSLVFLFGCNNNEKFFYKKKINDVETMEMVKLLKKINSEGDPLKYFHWNKQRAHHFKKKLINSPKQERFKIWLSYCYELLLSGQNQECIEEIETKIHSLEIKIK